MWWPSGKNPPRQLAPLVFWGEPPLGLNLVSDVKMLMPSEFAEALNVKLNDFGQWVTRDGLKKVSSAPTGGASPSAIKTIAYVPIGASTYIFLVDVDHKLYKCTGEEPNIDPGTSIGTLSGEAQLIPFHGYCVILDGSYIKVTQGTTVSLAYDDGDGLEGYQYNNTCASDDSAAAISLYSGAKTRCGSIFTTSSWGTGTLPLTALDIWLSKVGSPTGNIQAKLFNSAGDTLLATSDLLDVSTLTTSNFKKRFTFDGSYGLNAGTQYIICVEYSGGDSSNYLKVHGSTVSSGGDQEYYDSAWHNVSTANTNLGIKPGLPPKAKFGDIKETRLFVGGSPDYPGWVYYSNINTVFDWSTATSVLATQTGYDINGGGHIGVIDDNANAYPVGGIVSHFGDLYIFGTEKHPFISKLVGDTPNFYALPPLFQQIFCEHKTLKSLKNDIWLTSGDSVHNIFGVQQYGDIRTFSPGDPVKNIIHSYFSSGAFAEYNPKDGQYLLALEGYSDVFVWHTSFPIQVKDSVAPRYPVSTYRFKNLTPTAFASFNDEFYVGCSNGYLYRLDDTIVKDDGTLPDVELTSADLEMPANAVIVRDSFLKLVSSASASWTVSFYRNGESTAFLSKNFSSSLEPVRQRLNFSCDSIQIKLSNLVYTSPVNIQGISLSYVPIKRRGY